MINKRKRRLKKGIKFSLVIILLIILVNYIWLAVEDSLTNREFLLKNSDNVSETNDDIYDDIGEELSTLEKLQNLSRYDTRINNIIDNYNEYPEELLEMLTRNLEMLDFVLDYPQKVGNVYNDNIEEVKKGTIPLLLQWDTRWGYATYGDNSIAISGCGPTALSMVIIGLTGDKSLTPYKIAKFAEKNGYYLENSGTSWNLMTSGANNLGINSKEIPLSKDAIYRALENGHPIICSMRPGDFTTTGHFIVLIGIQDGKIRVNDPNSKKRSKILWTYEVLQPQIKNLWEFSK